TGLCCTALPADEGFRPSFLGHILVELLLDDALVAEDRQLLEQYYAALGRVDPQIVQHAVNVVTAQQTDRLPLVFERFREVRFLWDYADDAKLWFRLNQVLQRVRLSPLPESFQQVLGVAREKVAVRATELLSQKTELRRVAG